MVRHIETYLHNGRIGVLLMLESSDLFTIRTREFRECARNLALQIAALDACDSLATVEGATISFLLEQPFVKAPGKTVRDHLAEVQAELKAPVRIVKFERYSC